MFDVIGAFVKRSDWSIHFNWPFLVIMVYLFFPFWHTWGRLWRWNRLNGRIRLLDLTQARGHLHDICANLNCRWWLYRRRSIFALDKEDWDPWTIFHVHIDHRYMNASIYRNSGPTSLVQLRRYVYMVPIFPSSLKIFKTAHSFSSSFVLPVVFHALIESMIPSCLSESAWAFRKRCITTSTDHGG